MNYDCVIIGGGPAGLSAGLILGRAKLNVLLIDEEKPRNKVVSESHGFITNDGLSPVEIRKRAAADLLKYPTIKKIIDRVEAIIPQEGYTVKTKNSEFHTQRIIIATGLKEVLPDVRGLKALYGKTWFNCPFCDGWEMKDKKLGVLVENSEFVLHLAKMIFHWSQEIAIFTNGNALSNEIRTALNRNQIDFYEEKIEVIRQEEGLNKLYLKNQKEIYVEGGFLKPQFVLTLDFAKQLNLVINEFGRIQTDEFGQTSQENIYAAGDVSAAFAEQLVHAASLGSKVGSSIVKEIAFSNFK